MTTQMNFATKFKLHERIRLHLRRRGEYWEYIDGRSDHTIAEEFHLHPGQVQNHRRKYFGTFAPNEANLRSAPKTIVLEQKLDAITQALANDIAKLRKDLDNALANLEARISRVEHWGRGRGMDTPNGRMNVLKDVKEVNR
jgi:hypothetical protein